MKKTTLFLGLCCFVFFSLAIHLSAQSPHNELKTVVDRFLREYKVPAIAVAVIQADTIRYGISGFKRMGKKDTITFHSKFHLGSNTKAITAFIAAKMVEEGKIAWTDKLTTVLPELQGSILAAYQDITLESLLSHRALLPAFEAEGSSEFRHLKKTLLPAKDKRLAFAKYALNLAPVHLGTNNHYYSNGGYIIAALMMEAKSGQSWEDLVKVHFDQLDIDYGIGFPNESDLNQNWGHRKKTLAFLSNNKYKALPPGNHFAVDAYFAPAGDIAMDLLAFSTFIQLHLNGLMGVDNYLHANTYQKLHFGLPDYSLGWYNGPIGDTDQKFSYHGGSTGTFSSAVMISPDRKIAIILLVNAEDKNTRKLKEALRVYLWETFGQRAK
ncbi:MAG: serine hydrolase domain-containing protein [Saprospiraceae bacterium]